MSLALATHPDGTPLNVPGTPPFRCTDLSDIADVSFQLPPGDHRLAAIHAGGPAPCPPMENLVGMVRAWKRDAEWLDFLDPQAPNHLSSQLERDLYLHHFGPHLPASGRVLDLGGGVGRMTTALLDRGLEVELVDPDLRSLWRAVQHASGRPGHLDVHWSTGESLPEIEPVVAVRAIEVLCYAEDPARILKALRARMAEGALLLISVEARWGWAASLDVAPGSLGSLLSDGVVHMPGDRWVRTYEESDLRALLADWEIAWIRPTHFVASGPFEAAAGAVDLAGLLDLEKALAGNPHTAHLHRAWTAVARVPPRR